MNADSDPASGVCVSTNASSLPFFKTGKLGKWIAFSLVRATSPNPFDHKISFCGCAPPALPMRFVKQISAKNPFPSFQRFWNKIIPKNQGESLDYQGFPASIRDNIFFVITRFDRTDKRKHLWPKMPCLPKPSPFERHRDGDSVLNTLRTLPFCIPTPTLPA